MKRRAILFAASASSALAMAHALRPSHRAAKELPPIALNQQVPEVIDEWSIDRGIVPVLPDPSLQAALDQIYGQVLARTYVDRRGERVMLSIAYGEDQGTDATAAHRPEFCYTAQGFSVRDIGESELSFGGRSLRVRRLIGSLQARNEPITYWVTLNQTAVLPGVSRKLEQLRLGLLGQIPDGMLVRISTIGRDEPAGFRTQERFLAALYDALPPALRPRYFGAGRA